MKKKTLGIISAVLAILIATTVAVALLSVTKQTSTITVQTAGMDMTVGTPIVSGNNLYPGETFSVDVPITNTNHFNIASGNATLQNVTWYDGSTPMNGATSQLTIVNTQMLNSINSPVNYLPSTGDGTVRVSIQYSANADATYVGKTVKFNLNLPFSQN